MRRSPRGRRARGRGRPRATRRRRPRRCRRRPCRARRAPAPTPPRPPPTRGRVRPLPRSRTKTSERAPSPRASALNASRRPSADSRGSYSSSDIPGGAGTARSRPLRRSRTHDAGAAARLVRAVVGLVGDQPPVARDRRVVGRARDRQLGRVADLDRAAAAQVAGQDLHAPVALREVEVAERGLERDPAPVGRQRRVVVRARVGRLAARERGRRRGADGARHHRDLADAAWRSRAWPGSSRTRPPAVARQRRVVGVVRRGGRRGARRLQRRRAVVARLLQPARELAQLAREQPLRLRGGDRLARDALVRVVAQRRRRLLLRVPARQAVEAADLQRAELGAPQRRPLRAARDAEDRGRVRRGSPPGAASGRTGAATRWPWVSVRSARRSSSARRSGSRSCPRHGATSSRASAAGSHPRSCASWARLRVSSRSSARSRRGRRRAASTAAARRRAASAASPTARRAASAAASRAARRSPATPSAAGREAAPAPPRASRRAPGRRGSEPACGRPACGRAYISGRSPRDR